MSKPKLMLVYLLLVGGPLLGLLAILRAGERLVPPQSVGGAWNIEADFTSLTNTACRNLLASVKQPFLSISQSGSSLAFTLNNSQRTSLAGTLQNASLAAGPGSSSVSTAAAGNCLDPQAIHLEAIISKESGERILSGTLRILDCAECVPIPFRARRQGSSGSEGR